MPIAANDIGVKKVLIEQNLEGATRSLFHRVRQCRSLLLDIFIMLFHTFQLNLLKIHRKNILVLPQTANEP